MLWDGDQGHRNTQHIWTGLSLDQEIIHNVLERRTTKWHYEKGYNESYGTKEGTLDMLWDGDQDHWNIWHIKAWPKLVQKTNRELLEMLRENFYS